MIGHGHIAEVTALASPRLPRRRFMALLGAGVLAGPAAAAAPTPLTVLKSRGCGCCDGWTAHMDRAGFRSHVTAVDDLGAELRKRGVPDALSSCHLGLVGGYVIVGHVPAGDVRKLLRLRPKAVGLSVPGMPMGSPGMESADGRRETYEALLVLAGGRTHVFARHD